MSDTTRIIEKIRKLFAMANHATSNEQEAETAMRQADALLRKHNLTMTDITPEEAKSQVRESIMAKYKWTPGRAPVWAQSLATGVADLTDTFVIWTPAASNDSHVRNRQCNLCFVGNEADVITAGEMFNYLYETAIRLCDLHFDGDILGRRAKTIKNSYRYGMACRLRERFAEMVAAKKAELQEAAGTGTSLVVVKKDAIAAHLGRSPEDLGYKESNREQSLEHQSFAAGHRDGGGVSLNKQIGG